MNVCVGKIYTCLFQVSIDPIKYMHFSNNHSCLNKKKKKSFFSYVFSNNKKNVHNFFLYIYIKRKRVILMSIILLNKEKERDRK